MFLSAAAPRRIPAWSEPVDMRKSFDGLVAVVHNALGEDPLSGSLFVFFNRRGNYVKLVTWDRTGYRPPQVSGSVSQTINVRPRPVVFVVA